MRTLLASLLLALVPAAAAGKSLHWSELDVDAKLDDDGVLHVQERHSMVFDGDWNGGERVFDLRPGQKLSFRRLTRIDPVTGDERQLERGDLDRVDRWDWTSRDTLRWRSRRPTDPVFRDQTLVYRLEYELSGILRRQGNGYRLDHDFAFPDRIGRIEAFSLDLELDPAWSAPADLARSVRRANLAPGTSVVVAARLVRHAANPPAAVDKPVPTGRALALFAATFCLIGLLADRLWRAEAAQGRFERPAIPRPMTREWLEKNLFELLPEEAGALWDHRVAAPEVAAVIARMVAEGKLSSRVDEPRRWWKRPEMTLDLVADRAALGGYERKLVDKLFFDGRTTIDTQSLRKHYSSSGFDPASAIHPGISKRLRELPGGGERLTAPAGKVTLLLLVAVTALLALDGVTRGFASLGPVLAALLLLAPIPTLWAYFAAYRYRMGAQATFWGWLGFLAPLAVLFLLCLATVWAATGGREIVEDLRPGLLGVAALALLPLLVASSVLNQGRTRESRRTIELRQKLLAARRHFARELRKPIPDLDDAWFPYLLALGLSRRADAWAKTHGPGSSDWSAHPDGGGSRASATGWSGGGGSFGGAGATAAWTAAATGMAAGVPAPSSSGGGGSGGGGSSGGGGGGGW